MTIPQLCQFEAVGRRNPKKSQPVEFFGRVACAYVQPARVKVHAPVGLLQVTNARLRAGLCLHVEQGAEMKLHLLAGPMLAVVLAAGHTTPADARAKAIGRQKVSVEEQSFRVIRYDNGSVKVVDGGIFGDTGSYNLRERMRKAARLGTGCEISDDFWLDGKLIGSLNCPNEGAAS